MCIIAIKKRGVNFPTLECVRNMSANNPHGFAYVAKNHDTNEIEVVRTTDREYFLKRYFFLKTHWDKKNTTMIMHCRYATHGSICQRNCHGFEKDDMYFMHNGVLGDVDVRGDKTDSETFFNDLFFPIFKKYGWGKESKNIIDAYIGYSKFAFFDNKRDDVVLFGHYVVDNEILYSNTTYLKPRYKYFA